MLSFFLLFTSLFSHTPPLHAAAASRSLIENRAALPYGNGIAYETAASVARALARLEALRKGAEILGNDLAARIGTTETATANPAPDSPKTPQPSALPNELAEKARMRALASVVFPVSLLPDLSVSTPVPQGEHVDEAAIIARILDSPRDRTQAVRLALRQAENLDLRLLTLGRMEEMAQEGKELLLRSAAGGPRPDGNNPFAARAANVGRELEALEGYLLALRDFDQTWKDPAEAVLLLNKLTDLAPGNALVRMGLGEALLLSERPYEALENLETASRLPDAPPRAFYLRGVARLRLHLPANAADDFSQAIAARPDKAAWWRARGAARLLSGDEAAMCPDFYQACVLGDCDGLAEVRKRGFCQEPPLSAPQNASPSSPSSLPSAPGKNPKSGAGKASAQRPGA